MNKGPGFVTDFISFHRGNGIVFTIFIVFTVFHSALGCFSIPSFGIIKDSGRDRLYPSETLMPGYALISKNRLYYAAMFENGWFVISNINGHISYRVHSGIQRSRLVFQNDGNIVFYSPSNVPKWSSNFSKKRMCVTDRCVLIMQDDGNLVAYRGVLSVTTAFWSLWHSSKDVFDRVASKELSPMCPIFEDPKSISSNLLSTKPFHSGSPLVSISHDELLKHHRPWKQSNNNNNKDTSGAMSIFDLYALWRPEWVEDYKAMMLSPDGASIQQYVTQYNQTIYYGQRNVSGRYVTQYVATTVKRQHLNTGQDTNNAARKYINELVEASGVDATSHQDMYQSLNAGHVLLKVMGGPIKNWNLFPQYGTMNRDKWNALEKGIAEKIRDEGVFVVAEYYLQYGTTYETIPKYVHYSYRFFDDDNYFGRYVSSIRGVYKNILPNDHQVAYWAIYNNGSIPVVFVQDKNDGWTQGKLLDELNRQFANHMACLKNKFDIYDYDYDY